MANASQDVGVLKLHADRKSRSFELVETRVNVGETKDNSTRFFDRVQTDFGVLLRLTFDTALEERLAPAGDDSIFIVERADDARAFIAEVEDDNSGHVHSFEVRANDRIYCEPTEAKLDPRYSTTYIDRPCGVIEARAHCLVENDDDDVRDVGVLARAGKSVRWSAETIRIRYALGDRRDPPQFQPADYILIAGREFLQDAIDRRMYELNSILQIPGFENEYLFDIRINAYCCTFRLVTWGEVSRRPGRLDGIPLCRRVLQERWPEFRALAGNSKFVWDENGYALRPNPCRATPFAQTGLEARAFAEEWLRRQMPPFGPLYERRFKRLQSTQISYS